MKVLAGDELVFITFEFKECQIFCTPAVTSGVGVGGDGWKMTRLEEQCESRTINLYSTQLRL